MSTIRSLGLALLVGTFAGSAIAQTTTNCDYTPTGIDCESGPSGAAQLQAGIATFARAIALRRQRQQAIAAIRDDVQAGRCDDAIAIAAQYGTAQDVQTVRSACPSSEDRAAAAATERVDAEQSFNIDLARLVREGKCDEARRFALDNSRLDAADQAMRVCVPASSPASVKAAAP